MELFSPFGPFIGKTTVSDLFLNAVAERGDDIRDSHPYIRESHDYRSQLAGNIAEEYTFEETFLESKGLDTEIKVAVTQYLASVSRAIRRDVVIPFEYMELSEMWINYMKKGEWNPRHNHTGQVSLVIFLKVPEEIAAENTTEESVKKSNSPTSGKLQFSYGEHMKLSSSTFNVTPKEGDVYLFPSALYHQVYPFISNTERVSVSLNIHRSED